MIARNVLSIAPAARIWDVPLLPDTALGPPPISMANAILLRILRHIHRGAQRKDGSRRLPRGPWILVNAWGVFDPLKMGPGADPDPDTLGYWNDPGWELTRSLPEFGAKGIDVVFAAGNCGTPGAHPLCGESFIGPGRSITGANASPDVLTVGAVRVDGLPIGASAQGPGALAARWLAMQDGERPAPGPGADDARAKPDCSAPSHFRDPWSTGSENTGTSAACGVAAGVLAALRGLERAKGVTRQTPMEMRGVLRRTATRPRNAGFDARLGWGVVNLAAARHELCL